MKKKIFNLLNKKIISKQLIISVIGMGYVGLPLALLFGKKFKTIGLDISKIKIANLKKKKDYNKQCTLNEFKKSKYIHFSNKYESIQNSDIIIVCLPTPVYKNHQPDLRILVSASREIGKYLKKSAIVVYESTVFPGTVEEICSKIIEKNSKLTWKKNFHLGYSPERVNPNDSKHKIQNVEKIVSGDSILVTKLLKKIYQNIVSKKIILVNNIKVAETAKILENTQRDLNIALMNEVAIICNKLNISTKDTIDAAATKWNFAKFYPGLVGGHCIGVDPYYLKYKSLKLGIHPKIISAGRDVNDSMVNYVFKILKEKIGNKKRKLLFLGVTFKEDCNDMRNSKNIEVVKKFIDNKKHYVDAYDPFLQNNQYDPYFRKHFKSLKELRKDYFAVIILVPHIKILKKKFFFLNKIVNGGYLFDLKGMINKKNLNKELKYWSL